MDLNENRNPKTNNPNFSKVSKENGISRVQLIKWYKQKEKNLDSVHKKTRRRLPNSCNRAEHLLMEEELDQWMVAQRESGCLLSSFNIKHKTVEIERRICSQNLTIFQF